MAPQVIKAEWVVLPGGSLEEGPFFVTIEGDAITSICTDYQGSCSAEEWLTTHLLTPGFIDLHTHGVGEQDWRCGLKTL
jgi:N-acetylglucosamine-6-phosphate deacetylase